jgi:hypothetical protein
MRCLSLGFLSWKHGSKVYKHTQSYKVQKPGHQDLNRSKYEGSLGKQSLKNTNQQQVGVSHVSMG